MSGMLQEASTAERLKVYKSWDPLSPATMENSCTEAVLDEQVFMAINASGFSQAFIPCFTEDNDTTFFYGEVASQAMIDAAPDRLFSLNPPSEVAGEAGAQLIVDQGLIPAGAKVGILDSTNPPIAAAGESAASILEGAGYSTTTITVNTLSGDNAAANAEGAAAVAQFTAEGVDHVFVILPFIYAAGFWGEVGALQPSWDRTILDSASSNCTPFGASRTNPAAEGAICVTSYDSYASPNGGVGDDDAFEAQCRQEWIDHFPVFNGKSDKGAPSGEVGLETADGELLNSDYAPGECTMQYLIKAALENAGVNPTRDSFADAMRELSDLKHSDPTVKEHLVQGRTISQRKCKQWVHTCFTKHSKGSRWNIQRMSSSSELLDTNERSMV